MSVCPLYAHLRPILLPNLVNDNSFNTFCFVMSSDKHSVNSSLSKYIYYAIDVHKMFLTNCKCIYVYAFFLVMHALLLLLLLCIVPWAHGLQYTD